MRKVQALCLSDYEFKCFTRKNFKNLISLRFLELTGPKLEGNFEHLLPKLRWLPWHRCPPDFEAEMLNLVNLIVLDLSWSDISEDWKGWSITNMGWNLKVLNLSECEKLTRTPDLSKFSRVERLILSDCVGTEIDCCIRAMRRLKHLDLTGCHYLRGLPEEVCSLDALEEILMEGRGKDTHSFSLPKSIGNLVRLSVLELRRVRVNELPESICRLKKLKRLVLYSCGGIKSFPDLFGDLESLVMLDASGCDLVELPASFGNLKQLKVIKLGWTKIRHLPRTIAMLEQLEELNCHSMLRLSGAIPPEIDRLARLRCLDLSHTEIQVLLSLGNLSNLQTLGLHNCNNLLEVPELPPSLTHVTVNSNSVQRVSCDLSMLNRLVYLMWICPGVGWPWRGQESIASTHLSKLILGSLSLTKSIPQLSTLKNVPSLRLLHCTLGGTFQCLGVGGMKQLKDLEIIICDSEELARGSLPKNLERLVVDNCCLLTLLDVSHLRNLRHLKVSGC